MLKTPDPTAHIGVRTYVLATGWRGVTHFAEQLSISTTIPDGRFTASTEATT
jgi:hypothetical protein